MQTQLFTAHKETDIYAPVPTLDWRIADVIHALMIAFGWQATDLAKRADNMNPSVLYRLLDGRTKNPSEPTLKKLAKAFGISDLEIRNAVPTQPIRISVVIPERRQHHQRKRPNPVVSLKKGAR